MAFFKTIFNGLSKALDWLSGKEDEKLRAARARSAGGGEPLETDEEEEKGSEWKKRRSELERYEGEFDVWEEIDTFRTTFWFGSKVGKYLARPNKTDDKLKKELEELDRKREEEKRRKGEL